MSPPSRRSRSTKHCSSAAQEALKTATVAYDEAFLEPTGVKIRFKDTDTQLRAKEVLARELGDNYVVALNLLSNSPRWLLAIGAKPMYLGLDLRGGVHFCCKST
jgi:preprotein translocase subunit SecD